MAHKVSLCETDSGCDGCVETTSVVCEASNMRLLLLNLMFQNFGLVFLFTYHRISAFIEKPKDQFASLLVVTHTRNAAPATTCSCCCSFTTIYRQSVA